MRNGILLLLLIILASFAPPKSKIESGTLVIQEPETPPKFNPILSEFGSSEYMNLLLFQKLIERDPVTGELVPVLAKSLPVVEMIDTGFLAGGMMLTYEIRPEAKWDNGTPILTTDYIFSLKAYRNPIGKHAINNPFIYALAGVQIYPDNPRKFTVYTSFRSPKAIETFGMWVLPEYHYDPDQLLRTVTLESMLSVTARNEFMDVPEAQQFTSQFHALKFERTPGEVVGSGPYRLKEFGTDWWYGPIIFEKKENWWGEEFGDDIVQFRAQPEKIKYVVLDPESSVKWFQRGEVDIIRGVSISNYQTLMSKKKTAKRLISNLRFNFEYVVVNHYRTGLDDPQVRKALDMCIDRRAILSNIQAELGRLISGPIHPSKEYYKYTPTEYNLNKAKELLERAGWTDVDQDGIREKKIGDHWIPLKFTIKFNDNDKRRAIAKMMITQASLIGVELLPVQKQWHDIIAEAENRDFDLMISAWQHNVGFDDLIRQYHSSQIKGGANVMSYQNAELDSLMLRVAQDMEPASRKVMYERIQDIIVEDRVNFYLYVPENNMFFSKRVKNPHSVNNRIGFDVRRLTVK